MVHLQILTDFSSEYPKVLMSPNLNSKGIMIWCWGVYWKTLRSKRSQLKCQAPLQHMSIPIFVDCCQLSCHVICCCHAWSRQVPIMQRKPKPVHNCCLGSWPWQFFFFFRSYYLFKHANNKVASNQSLCMGVEGNKKPPCKKLHQGNQ